MIIIVNEETDGVLESGSIYLSKYSDVKSVWLIYDDGSVFLRQKTLKNKAFKTKAHAYAHLQRKNPQ